jgi:hypothetical protein
MAGGAADAQAQLTGVNGAQGMPSPAVFGGARREQPGIDNVSMSTSAFGGYDTNILASEAGGVGGGTIGSAEQTSSTFVGASANMHWARTRPRYMVFGDVGAQYRAFFDISDFDVQAYDGNIGVTTRLTRRSSLSLGVNFGVQPFYQFGALNPLGGGFQQPGTGPVFTADLQAARELVLRYGVQGVYNYQLSSKTSFIAEAGRNGFEPLNATQGAFGLTGVGSTYAAARISRRLTTNLSARLGYGYSQFDPVEPSALTPEDQRQESFGVHNIDIGVDYARALALDRRTSFSFGTGTNIRREATNVFAGESGGTRFEVGGFATLQRQFLRTWAASLRYTRGTSYLEGFNELGVFDTASASVAGLFTDRLDASAGLSYTTGAVSLAGDDIASINGGAQIRYGFTSNLAAFLGYTYARFDVPDSRIPDTLVGRYRPDRQGVRFGITAWLDLLR